MREEVLIRMGLDQKPLAAGLQTAGQRTSQWAEKEGRKMGRFFTRGFDGMFKAFSLAGMVMGLRSTADEINSLKDNTEELEKRFGKLGDAQIRAAEDISEGFKNIERTGKTAAMTVAASFTTLFEVLASKLTTDLSIGEILDDMAAQAIKDVGPKNAARVQELIEQYHKLKKEIDFSHMDLDEQIASLQAAHKKNLEIIQDENTLAEQQVKLATENLKISEQLDKLLMKKIAKGGEFIPLPEELPSQAQPLSPIRQQLIERQEALRKQMVGRFGDPNMPDYRDPAKAAFMKSAEVNEALLNIVTPDGLKVTPGD